MNNLTKKEMIDYINDKSEIKGLKRMNKFDILKIYNSLKEKEMSPIFMKALPPANNIQAEFRRKTKNYTDKIKKPHCRICGDTEELCLIKTNYYETYNMCSFCFKFNQLNDERREEMIQNAFQYLSNRV